MVKMRSVSEAYETLKREDPSTAITQSGLRRLVKTGKIPSIRIGRRILVNYNSMLYYLNNPTVEVIPDQTYGKIRKIT